MADDRRLVRLLVKSLFDGYDTYEDYVKYGEAFIRLEPKPRTSYTPVSHQLTA